MLDHKMLMPVAVAVLSLGLLACTSGGVALQNGLPEYVDQGDGAFTIDLGQASGGEAEFRPEAYSIAYQSREWEGSFHFYTYAGSNGVERLQRLLDHLSVRISPELAPDDGIASLFVTVKETRESLLFTVFLDTGWQGVAPDGLFLSIAEWGPGFPPLEAGYPVELVIPVNFSEAVNGLYVQEFEFPQAENPPGYRGSPNLYLSNVEGTVSDIRRGIRTLEWDADDWVIGFSRWLDLP